MHTRIVGHIVGISRPDSDRHSGTPLDKVGTTILVTDALQPENFSTWASARNNKIDDVQVDAGTCKAREIRAKYSIICKRGGGNLVRAFLGQASRGFATLLIAGALSSCGTLESVLDGLLPGPAPGSPAAVTAACEARGGNPISDLNLRAAIRASLDIDTGPTCQDLARLTQLRADEVGIESLAGLEYAPVLRAVWVERNDVSSLAPLSETTSLRYLYAGGNRITDIAPLAELVDLEGISLWGNPLTSLEPLRNLSELVVLKLGYGMEISDTSPLRNKPRLSNVDIGGAGIRDLDFLAGAEDLWRLIVPANGITDASVLARATKLERLDLGFNSISDFSFLTSLPHLETVMVPGNPVADPAPFASLTNVRHLSLLGTGIRDIGFVAAFSKLETFISCDNELADLTALESLPALNYVNVSFNVLADISPLGRNEALGEGTEVHVFANCLDLSPGSVNSQAIEALRARGAIVVEHPQWQSCGP